MVLSLAAIRQISGLEIKRLLDDHGLRRDMGNAGQRAVQTKYSWTTIGKQMLDVYADILADRQTRFQKCPAIAH